MKSETQSITLTINRREGIEIRNALLKARGDALRFEDKGPRDLFAILGGNFEASHKDIHFTSDERIP